MFIFKHPKDLSQLPPGSLERSLLRELLKRRNYFQSRPSGYDPELYGYVVLIERRDVYRRKLLPELPQPLTEVPWEGVTLERGFFHGIVLTNNEFGLDFLIPDKRWLPIALRKALEAHLPL